MNDGQPILRGQLKREHRRRPPRWEIEAGGTRYELNDGVIAQYLPGRLQEDRWVAFRANRTQVTKIVATKFIHAYNFVPLEGDGPKRSRYRPHDGWTAERLYSGAFRCRMTFDTPVFIGGQRTKDKDGHTEIDFFRFNRAVAIPPSELKGMIRTVFEAATNSCLSKFESGRVKKRDDARNSWARQLLPGRLERHGDDWKVRVMAAAWVPMNGTATLTDRQNVHAVVDPTNRHNNVPWSCAVTQIADAPGLVNQPGQLVVEGYLKKNGNPLATAGGPGPRKHDERLFFIPTAVPNGSELAGDVGRLTDAGLNFGQLLDVDPDVVARYGNVLKEQHDLYQKNGMTPTFSPSVQDGALVYFLYNNHAVRHLSRTGIPKFEMKTDRRDLVGGHAPCNRVKELCTACRVFGMVAEGPEPAAAKADALAGRVTPSVARWSGSAVPKLQEQLLPPLSSPRPTASEFYLERKDNGDQQHIHWDQATKKNARIRGRKFYRHSRPRFIGQHVGAPDNLNATVALLPENDQPSVFEFVIWFSELDAEELGALAWCLNMPDPLRHKIGMGKPLGLGSCKVEIAWDAPEAGEFGGQHTHLLDLDERYASLASDGRKYAGDDVKIADDKKAELQKHVESLAAGWRDTRAPVDAFQQLIEMLTFLTDGHDNAKLPTTYPSADPSDVVPRDGFWWFQMAGQRHVLPRPSDERQNPLQGPPPPPAQQPRGNPGRGDGGRQQRGGQHGGGGRRQHRR